MQPVRLKIKHNVALLLSVSFLPCFLAYGITPQTPKEDETAVVAEADAKEVAETGADTEAACSVRSPTVGRTGNGRWKITGRSGSPIRRRCTCN